MIQTIETLLAEMERCRSEFHRAYSKMESAQKHIGEVMSLNIGQDLDYSTDLKTIADAIEDMRFYSSEFTVAKEDALHLLTNSHLPPFKENEL